MWIAWKIATIFQRAYTGYSVTIEKKILTLGCSMAEPPFRFLGK